MTTQQIETATIIGTITKAGNASLVVTSAYMPNSPKTVTFAVGLGDDAAAVADAGRTALALTADVTSVFAVSGTGADIVLTSHVARANDTTLNIASDNDTCEGLTAAPTSTDTQAGTGITNGYATLAEFKAYILPRGGGAVTADVADDAVIEDLIEAASRDIDKFCARQFWAESSDSTAYYTPEASDILFILDYASITSVSTDDTADRTWATTLDPADFDELPFNHTAEGLPITRLEIAPLSSEGFPIVSKGVKIVGKRGWPSVPDDIKSACLEITMERWMNRSGQTSVAGQVTVTAAGVVIRPGGISDSVMASLRGRMRER
jgi:hypothetical protein